MAQRTVRRIAPRIVEGIVQKGGWIALVVALWLGCTEPGGRHISRDAGRAVRARASWARIAGLPSHCHVEVAEDPGAALPRLAFEPCPGRAGCRRAIVDWPAFPGTQARLGLHRSSAADEAHAFFTWLRPVESDGRWWWYTVVARDDGEPLLVLRSPPDPPNARLRCAGTQVALTPRSFAKAILVWGESGAGRSILLRARFEAPVRAWATLAERPAIDDVAQEIETSDTTTVLESAAHTYRVGPDDSIDELLLPAGASSVDAVLGDEVFATMMALGRRWQGVRVAPDSNTPSELQLGEPGAGVLRPDGERLAFLRRVGLGGVAPAARIELWVRDASGSARFVARVPTHGAGRSIGHRLGRAWIGEALDVVGVYDITSGERREYRSPSGRIVRSHPILGPQEIVVPVAYPDLGRGLETIELIPYDALPVAPPLSHD